MSFDVFVEPAGITKPFVESGLCFALHKPIIGVCVLHKVVAMPVHRDMFDRAETEGTQKTLIY